MSVLIFEASTAGYLEAARLHKHFKEQGRDRQAWDRCKNPFVPGGKRQLYGYLATREDLDIFNKHSGGHFSSPLIVFFFFLFSMSRSSSWVERLGIEIIYDEFEYDNTKLLNCFGSLRILSRHTSLCLSSVRCSCLFVLRKLLFLLSFCIIFGMNVAVLLIYDICILV
jgi:hypothetical protein